MPRSKRLSSYPSEYRSLVYEVVTENKVSEASFSATEQRSARRQAEAVRGDFYAFLQAAYLAAEKAPGDMEVRAFADLASRVFITLRAEPDGRVTLVFQDRDRGWKAEALAGRTTRDVAPLKAIPQPDAALLAMAGLQPDGTAQAPSARSEQRDAEASKSLPEGILGKSNKDKYY